MNIYIDKAWAAFNRLQNSHLSKKVKRDFIKAIAVSVLMYSGTKQNA